MPFTSDFDDFYAYGIKESCKDAESYCERVDEQNYEGSILERIYNQIAKADLIIADMTGRNPNVFYEVGYAHALNKPTILLTQDSNDIPFDLKHYPHIIYEKKISTIRTELTKKINWFKENKKINNSNSMNIDIDMYVDGKNLSMENVTHDFNINQIPNFYFLLHNNSFSTYSEGDVKVGIITEEFDNMSLYRTGNNKLVVKTINLPDNKYLHLLTDFELILPFVYSESQHVTFFESVQKSEYDITLRLFTKQGYRDYPLTLRRKSGL
jgi:nucleoside 2-deoxyribosyltransferase